MTKQERILDYIRRASPRPCTGAEIAAAAVDNRDNVSFALGRLLARGAIVRYGGKRGARWGMPVEPGQEAWRILQGSWVGASLQPTRKVKL